MKSRFSTYQKEFYIYVIRSINHDMYLERTLKSTVYYSHLMRKYTLEKK